MSDAYGDDDCESVGGDNQSADVSSEKEVNSNVLIPVVQGLPQIWQKQHQNYCSSQRGRQVTELWHKVLDRMGIQKKKNNVKTVRSKWTRLVRKFKAEHASKPKPPSGSAPAHWTPKFKYYYQMLFILENVQKRVSSGNHTYHSIKNESCFNSAPYHHTKQQLYSREDAAAFPRTHRNGASNFHHRDFNDNSEHDYDHNSMTAPKRARTNSESSASLRRTYHTSSHRPSKDFSVINKPFNPKTYTMEQDPDSITRSFDSQKSKSMTQSQFFERSLYNEERKLNLIEAKQKINSDPTRKFFEAYVDDINAMTPRNRAECLSEIVKVIATHMSRDTIPVLSQKICNKTRSLPTDQLDEDNRSIASSASSDHEHMQDNSEDDRSNRVMSDEFSGDEFGDLNSGNELDHAIDYDSSNQIRVDDSYSNRRHVHLATSPVSFRSESQSIKEVIDLTSNSYRSQRNIRKRGAKRFRNTAAEAPMHKDSLLHDYQRQQELSNGTLKTPPMHNHYAYNTSKDASVGNLRNPQHNGFQSNLYEVKQSRTGTHTSPGVTPMRQTYPVEHQQQVINQVNMSYPSHQTHRVNNTTSPTTTNLPQHYTNPSNPNESRGVNNQRYIDKPQVPAVQSIQQQQFTSNQILTPPPVQYSQTYNIGNAASRPPWNNIQYSGSQFDSHVTSQSNIMGSTDPRQAPIMQNSPIQQQQQELYQTYTPPMTQYGQKNDTNAPAVLLNTSQNSLTQPHTHEIVQPNTAVYAAPTQVPLMQSQPVQNQPKFAHNMPTPSSSESNQTNNTNNTNSTPVLHNSQELFHQEIGMTPSEKSAFNCASIAETDQAKRDQPAAYLHNPKKYWSNTYGDGTWEIREADRQ